MHAIAFQKPGGVVCLHSWPGGPCPPCQGAGHHRSRCLCCHGCVIKEERHRGAEIFVEDLSVSCLPHVNKIFGSKGKYDKMIDSEDINFSTVKINMR